MKWHADVNMLDNLVLLPLLPRRLPPAALHGESWHGLLQGPVLSISPDIPFQNSSPPSIPLISPIWAIRGAWRRGERSRSKDRGPMSESCRGCDTADLSILMPRMKGSPGGPVYKDPNAVLHCHVLGTCAAAFLFLVGSAVFVLRARGRGIFHLL